ncbi:phage tail tape measure protein [Bacillus sp. CH30_1T]|uniref:phage tail tape measure protein n=1 Tax=Bacillus sp. CH30_1T TaxID=2604836 RepID=UPI0011EF3BED|nr:phage tail tape measure protein [Bacillus sp. CH30_1T]KAA0563674.1 phage tail tape measure protein [Bacillus sp. CH30_1T]
MADKAKNVVLNFKMDGQVQYAETLKDINTVMNTAAKEYKNHIAAMGNDAKVTDKLRAEKKKLEIQMEAGQKRTKMLRAQYEAMSKDTKTTTGQLTRMYSKLLDAERAESSLQKAMDRVNGGLTEQAQEARDAQDTLGDLKKESGILEAEQKKLTSAFKLQSAELGDNATESEKLELAQRQLNEQTDLTERTIENLEKQLDATKKIYGENSIEVIKMETKLNNARITMNKFSGSLDNVENSSDDAGDGLESLGKKMDLNNIIEATELLQGVSDKLIEIGQAGMESALQVGESQTNLQANLGVTTSEAEELNNVVTDVFKNGVVGSVEEATKAVIIIKQNFKDLNESDLENLTNQITTLAKRTGTDVQENVIAAQKLMSEFGLSGQEAMDLISAGYQDGINKSGDFTDTINEYAPLFADAQFSAGEMLTVMKNGLDGGALNADKAADAIKEMQIRFGDGSFENQLENFSSGTGDLFEKWQNGEATMAQVMESIKADIQKMDTTDQQAALTNLGTQFEDLGVRGTVSVLSVGDAFEDVTGKADEMAQKSPGEEWESSLRELESSLVPIGQNLIDALSPVIDGLAKMGEWFTKLPGSIQTFIVIFGAVIAIAAIAIPIVLGLAAAGAALNIAWLPIIAIILAVAAAIAGIILVIKNWGAITEWLGDKWDQFISWLYKKVPELAVKFVSWINDMKQGAINKFSELVVGGIKKFVGLKTQAGNVITGFKNDVFNKANEIKTGFVNKANELKDGAVNKFNDLKNKAGSIMQSAKDKIVSPIESAKVKISGIVDIITGFFSGMKLSIPEIKLPRLPKPKITGSFSLTPPRVPTIKWNAKGAIFTQPTIFGQNGGKLQGGGEAGPEAALPLNEKTLGDIGRGIATTMSQVRDNRPIILQIDGKTFARITGDYIDTEGGHRIRRIQRGLA